MDVDATSEPSQTRASNAVHGGQSTVGVEVGRVQREGDPSGGDGVCAVLGVLSTAHVQDLAVARASRKGALVNQRKLAIAYDLPG